ncbi:tyrosine-type recombinase/integrase [Geodermatophilus sp. SYSU D00742]
MAASQRDAQRVELQRSSRQRSNPPIPEPAERLLRRLHAAQAEERRLAGSAWRQTGSVSTTEFGEPFDPRDAFRALRAAATKAGPPHAGLHPLRHSTASVMLGRGVPLEVVSDILGHSSIVITGDIHGHVSPDVARQAMDTLGDAFDRWAIGHHPCSRHPPLPPNSSQPDPRPRPGVRRARPRRTPGRLMVVNMVVKPPRKAVRGRSGSLRTRPLSCGFPPSG